MTIEVVWDDEAHTVIRHIFSERWTWEEFFAAIDEAQVMIDTAPGPIGVIIDGRAETMQMPPNMLSNGRTVLSRAHPRTKIVVVVIRNPFINVMVMTLSRISGARGRTLLSVDNIDEARRLVHEHLAKIKE